MGRIQKAIPGSSTDLQEERYTIKIKTSVSLLFCLIRLKSIITIKQNNYDKNKI